MQSFAETMLNLPVVKLENANTPDWPAEGAFTFITRLECHCSSIM